MEFPIYNNKDLEFAIRDGAIEISDFATFISELINRGILDRPEEVGVARFVDANGTHSLSEKQAKVLKIIVEKFGNKNCQLCSCKIPLDEVVESIDNGNYCGHCAHIMSKD